MARCDLCEASTAEEDLRHVPVNEMLLIALNRYGERLEHWPGDPEERAGRLLAEVSMRDAWALCPACHEDTRPFTKDTKGGATKAMVEAAMMKADAPQMRPDSGSATSSEMRKVRERWPLPGEEVPREQERPRSSAATGVIVVLVLVILAGVIFWLMRG